MIIEVRLNKIDANPWQPRTTEDAAHILKIAESIAAQGLMQEPVGRMIVSDVGPVVLPDKMSQAVWDAKPDGYRVQLAFGHTRLAAYKILARIEAALQAGQAVDDDLTGDQYDNLLAAADKAVEDGRSWRRMPVSIMALTDEQMFAQGVQENLARKDLTAFEEARAMVRYRDDFGKNSGQIGQLFGLADSTVRNKLRLLDLPKEIQDQAAGLPEVMLRELVSMYALPEAVRALDYYGTKFDDLIQGVLKHKTTTAEDLRRYTVQLITGSGKDMSDATWKFDREFLGIENESGSLDYPDCKTCSARVQYVGKNFCVRPSCYARRMQIVKIEYLAEAAKVCGIPVGDEKLLDARDWEGGFTQWMYSGEAPRFGQVLATRCSNLRLRWVSSNNGGPKDRVEGYPHAQVVCQKRKGNCVCDKALQIRGAAPAPVSAETAKTLVTVFEGEEELDPQIAQMDAETAVPEQLTEERLKEIAQATRRQQRANIDVVRRMEDQAVVALFKAVEHPAFWRVLLRRVGSFQAAEKLKDASLMDVKAAVFRYVLQHDVLDISFSDTPGQDPAKCEKRYNDFLAQMGLALPWSVAEAEAVK